MKKIPLYINSNPEIYMEITQKTTINSIKEFLKKYNPQKIQLFLDDKTESKIFDTDKYDNYNLSSIWNKMTNPAIKIKTITFDNIPSDVIQYMIEKGEIKGKDLINFCVSNKKLNYVCNKNNQEIFRKLLTEKYPNIPKKFWPDPRKFYIDEFINNYIIVYPKQKIIPDFFNAYNMKYILAELGQMVSYYGKLFVISGITKTGRIKLKQIGWKTIKDLTIETDEQHLMYFPNVDGYGSRLIAYDSEKYFPEYGGHGIYKTEITYELKIPDPDKKIGEKIAYSKKNITFKDLLYLYDKREILFEKSKNVLVKKLN